MKPKNILAVALLLFVAASVVAVVVKERNRQAAAPAPAVVAAPADVEPAPSPVEQKSRVVVMYLHGSKRCPTCMRIEETARRVCEEVFQKPIESGEMEWQSLDYEEPANAHLMKDYGLAFQSVVLSERKGTEELRWKNLEKVWDNAHDPVALEGYIEGEIMAFLSAATP